MKRTLRSLKLILGLLVIQFLSGIDSQTCGGSTRKSDFKRLNGVDIIAANKSSVLIETIQDYDKMKCLSNCNIDCLCYLVILNGNVCSKFTQESKNFLISNPQNVENVFVKKTISAILNILKVGPTIFTNGLVHYWPISGPYPERELIGGKDMMLNTFHNAEFSNDRFGNPNSALYLNHGYVKVPSGEYFDPATGGFTIMLWIKPFSNSRYLDILDFGSGTAFDNILIEFYAELKRLKLYVAIDSNIVDRINGNSAIVFNEWTHIAFTFSGDTYSIYINGVLDISASGYAVNYRKVVRTNNFIGWSNWLNSDQQYHGLIDELKIFDRALDQTEIATEMNKADPYQTIYLN